MCRAARMKGERRRRGLQHRARGAVESEGGRAAEYRRDVVQRSRAHILARRILADQRGHVVRRVDEAGLGRVDHHLQPRGSDASVPIDPPTRFCRRWSRPVRSAGGSCGGRRAGCAGRRRVITAACRHRARQRDLIAHIEQAVRHPRDQGGGSSWGLQELQDRSCAARMEVPSAGGSMKSVSESSRSLPSISSACPGERITRDAMGSSCVPYPS